MDGMIHGMGRVGCRENCTFSSRGEEVGEERERQRGAHNLSAWFVCLFGCVGFLSLVLI